MLVLMLMLVVVPAAALPVLLPGLVGKALELGGEGVLALHGLAQLRPVELIPGRGDDNGALIVLAQHLDAGSKLALAHALGAGEDYRAGVLNLVAPELAEVLHIHLRPRGVHDGGEAAGHELGVAHVLHGADNVAELADAAGLNQYPVGVELLLDLLEGLGEVADKRAADAAGAHLGYLHARVGKEAAVDGDLAELVFNEHKLLALVGLGDKLLYKRGLARAEEAGEYVDFSHTLLNLLIVIQSLGIIPANIYFSTVF